MIFGFYDKLWPILVLGNRSHTSMGSPINTFPVDKCLPLQAKGTRFDPSSEFVFFVYATFAKLLFGCLPAL